MNDFKSLEIHMNHRFDKLETKIDKFAEKTTAHDVEIRAQRGVIKMIVSILLACFGFLALAYFKP